ncbi:hypothetical protein IGK74_002484 [Enterococcus sp. AZ150]|uniref:LPXTG cell wall anchor domain-containing protein n=1 Tax=Enterococcus sp. AZ150 TaxID=2774866 RepID=UPI003F2027D6
MKYFKFLFCLVTIPILLYSSTIYGDDGGAYSTNGQAGFYGVYEPETSGTISSEDTNTNNGNSSNSTNNGVGSQQIDHSGNAILPSTGSQFEGMLFIFGTYLLCLAISMIYIIKKREDIL